jgi:hypothetical protein
MTKATKITGANKKVAAETLTKAKGTISKTDAAATEAGNVVVFPDRKSIPKRDASSGELLFPDFPKFRPNLTPKEVLQSGAFGGTYFRPIRSAVTRKTYGDEVWKELPKDWIEGLDVRNQVASPVYDENVNKWRVKCGNELSEWEAKGWITSIDPYGWFQWYCRFYLGRRSSDDERQISRGLGVMGPTGRWRRALENKLLASRSPERALEDSSISPKIRQLLMHWGYQPTVAHLTKAAKKANISA